MGKGAMRRRHFWRLGLVVSALWAVATLTACASPKTVDVQPTATSTSTPIPCNPEEFVKQYNIEPPIAVSGNQNDIPPIVMDAALKLGACQTPTAEEQTAIHEFNEQHPFLGWAPAAVLSKETSKIITPSQKELNQARQEALARGEQRLVFQKDLFDIGGKIEQTPPTNGGDIVLQVRIPPGQNFTFLSPLEGEIVGVLMSNDKTTNIVRIQNGSYRWSITSPSTSILAKETVKGAKVSLGTPLFSVAYDPTSKTQQDFEAGGAPIRPKGTIATIGSLNLIEGTTISGNVLQNAQGEFLTQGSLP